MRRSCKPRWIRESLGKKQRSPAGARRAEEEIHQIEKICHRETVIVRSREDWVKLRSVEEIRFRSAMIKR
jgi:hypothetical protein